MAVQMACLMEAASEKPGNVTPTRAFDDLEYTSFLLSSSILGNIFRRHAANPVGTIIFEAVRESQRATGTNAHLGVVLLLAPLAHAFCKLGSLNKKTLSLTLNSLSKKDAELAYRAIRLANPGGLGKAPKQDVRKKPDVTLQEAMGLAADRDWIAHEYARGFPITLDFGAPEIKENIGAGLPIREAVAQTFLGIMSRYPDSLIARKNDPEMARQASHEAGRILKLGGMFSPRGRKAIYEFDQTLRIGSNILNPGTTADLTAAALFVYFMKHGYGALKARKG